MAPLDRAADPNGFSRATADAVGVGKREALGVRQLAAALFLCANNVPRTRSAWYHKQCVCPHICIRGVATQTSVTADCYKGQSARHAAIRRQDPNNEPVTLFGSLLDVRGWQAACTQSIHLPAHSVAKGRSGGGATALTVAGHAPKAAGSSSALLHRMPGPSEAESRA
ncbi:MAG: hypothetical protein GX456_14710 [Verrucomicrobia bacterium]|nr:hypothetical protein [Verrucomicrobiota bacterium]